MVTRSTFWAAGFVSLLVAIQVLAILVFNNGHFTYSIDDPYIHLDLATTLWQTGLYGVNPGAEAVSPSSSPIWTFLLAPFSNFSWQALVPLGINIFACLLCLPVLQQLLAKIAGRWQLKLPPVAEVVILLVLAVAFNLIGIIFMGLEHNLQILLALLMALATVRMVEEKRAPDWLWPVLILAPLVRYENLALVAVTLGVFSFWVARWRSVVAGVAIVVTLGWFTLFLLSLGLDPLPNSVMMRKSLVGNPMTATFVELLNGLSTSHAIYSMILLVPILLVWLFRQRHSLLAGDNRILLAVLFILLAQIAGGKFGPPSLNRYEIYALSYCWMLLPYAGSVLFQRMSRNLVARGLLIGIFAAAVPSNFYCSLWGSIPYARAIYLQQGQMQDFVLNVWKQPVAVNDIGLVGYHNPHYVLDLWGLSSVEARNIHWKGKPTDFADLVKRHGVDLVMVYSIWFRRGELEQWYPVAVLHRQDGLTVLGESDVHIYATRKEALETIVAALQSWEKRLSPGASLSLEPLGYLTLARMNASKNGTESTPR